MESPYWYVLNYIPRGRRVSAETTVGKYSTANSDDSLEVFAPTYVEMVRRDGDRWERTERPLLYHYVFVRGSEQSVKGLCSAGRGFSLILNRTGEGDCRYLTATPESIDSFRRLAMCYRSAIPCYLSDEVELESGDLVEIASGEFAGIRGRYVPKAGGRSGYVSLSVTQGMHALVLGVRSDYLRILEFSHEGRRLYDQLDAYQPRLYRALRSQRLTASELSPVQLFVRRLGSTVVSDGKVRVRLQLLLWASYRLLGDVEAADALYRRIELPENPWLRLLHGLLRHRLDGDALPAVPEDLVATSAPHRALLKEYETI